MAGAGTRLASGGVRAVGVALDDLGRRDVWTRTRRGNPQRIGPWLLDDATRAFARLPGRLERMTVCGVAARPVSVVMDGAQDASIPRDCHAGPSTERIGEAFLPRASAIARDIDVTESQVAFDIRFAYAGGQDFAIGGRIHKMPGPLAPLISAVRNMLYRCRMSGPVVILIVLSVDNGTIELSPERT